MFRAVRHLSFLHLAFGFAFLLSGCLDGINHTQGQLVAKILAVTGPATIYRDFCSGPYFVNSRNEDQLPTNVAGNVQIQLSGLGSATVYVEQNCVTPTTSRTMAAKSNTVSFYVRSPQPQSLTLTASADGLKSGSLAVSIASPGDLSVTTIDGSNDFGDIRIGESSSRTFRVQNMGTLSLTGLSVSLDLVTPAGAFDYASTVDCRMVSTLAAGSACQIVVKFAPNAIGNATATLNITAQDPVIGQILAKRDLTGKGNNNPPPRPDGGEIDDTFNNGGSVIQIGSGTAWSNAVAVQADGKVVAVGGYNGDFLIARYNENGSLDTSFGPFGNGIQTTDIGGNLVDEAFAVALQPDGKIVVAGTTNGNKIVALRYHAVGALAGQLDTSFNGTGIYTNSPAGGGKGRAVGIQTISGVTKIIVGGHNFYDFLALRLNLNGTLDTTFGTSGIAKANVFDVDQARAMAIGTDGKIVLAGPVYNLGKTYSGIARFNANGTLDTSFSGDGVAAYDLIENGEAYIKAVAIQADGKVVVGGDTYDGYILFRMTTAGTLDSTFGTNGIRLTSILGYDIHDGRALAIQADGKIVLAGSFRSESTGQFEMAVLRYLPTGALDTTFSGSGIVALNGDGDLTGNGIALDPNPRKIVVVGSLGTAMVAIRFWQ